jgi:hypothetical protein
MDNCGTNLKRIMSLSVFCGSGFQPRSVAFDADRAKMRSHNRTAPAQKLQTDVQWVYFLFFVTENYRPVTVNGYK